MKPRQDTSKRRAANQRELYQAILSLETETECRAFFEDLCTPAELEALVDRWSVVRPLDEGQSYRRIHELTGVSVTTIGRVARYLTRGSGGYRTVLERLSSK